MDSAIEMSGTSVNILMANDAIASSTSLIAFYIFFFCLWWHQRSIERLISETGPVIWFPVSVAIDQPDRPKENHHIESDDELLHIFMKGMFIGIERIFRRIIWINDEWKI